MIADVFNLESLERSEPFYRTSPTPSAGVTLRHVRVWAGWRRRSSASIDEGTYDLHPSICAYMNQWGMLLSMSSKGAMLHRVASARATDVLHHRDVTMTLNPCSYVISITHADYDFSAMRFVSSMQLFLYIMNGGSTPRNM